ncbi:MAG TPA: HDIG domain-containing protein [Longimicrobiales bacterium]|nr:HDIG domain-containing protein [Longimicrobiales bacterium]
MTDTGFSLRDALATINRRPERTWPDGVIHHGVRIAILLGLALVVHFLFPVAPIPDMPTLEKGMVATKDIIAQAGFPIYKSESELERDRQEAAAGVAPIFVYDGTAADSMLAQIRGFFARIDSAASLDADSAAIREKVAAILNSYGPRPTDDFVRLLLSPRPRRQLDQSLTSAVRDELPLGIASAADLEDAGAQQIRVRRGNGERLVARDSVLTSTDFLDRAGRYHLGANRQPDLAEFQRLMLLALFEPSLRYDRAATEAERERTRQAVPLVKGRVLQGEQIVGAHQLVGDREAERLRAYRQYLTQMGEVGHGGLISGRAMGAFGFDLTLLLVFGTLLYFFRRTIYDNLGQLGLIVFLVLALVGAAAIVAKTQVPVVLIPIAFPALVVAVLWDGRLALNMSLVLAILLSGQTPFLGGAVLTTLVTLVMAGAAASLSVRVVRRRAQTWSFILIIAAAYALSIAILGLLRSWDLMEIARYIGWSTMSAVGGGLAAMGFMPLFETATKITTDQTLLELADMNRPLLRRLSREAPGTYAHSIAVANLAEAAASAIDANALLTRVGVYYHDVGKIAKPQYFIENQPGGRNPHDKLKPAMSAAVVRGHVIEGLRLADDAKLPRPVRAFIAEHHGTQPISFFYEKARELNPEAELDPGDFRYPGPRPQSKETAIAMLADSVESAARVLPDPTPQRIRELVDRIVKTKMDLDQLDDTPMTLAELTRVKEQFTNILTGMYHHRIDYPAKEERPAEPQPEAREAGVP